MQGCNELVEDREVETMHDLAITIYYPTLAHLDERTVQSYWRDTYLKHIKGSIAYMPGATKPFGDFPFSLVRKFHIQNLINGVKGKNGTGAYGVVTKVHMVLKHIFSEAVDNDILDSSPVVKIKLPSKPEKIKLLVSQQDIALKACTCPDFMVLPILLPGIAGMRVGEVIGLQWLQIDRENLRIYIDRQKAKNGGYKLPKGKKSASIDITPEILAFLDRFGNIDSPFVCTNPRTGKAWSHSAMGREWKLLKLPASVGPHHLRHLAATIMAGHNVIMAKNMLRHTDLKTTMGYVDEGKISSEGAVRLSAEMLKSVVRNGN